MAKIDNYNEFVDMEAILQSYYIECFSPIVDEEYDKLEKNLDKEFNEPTTSNRGSLTGNIIDLKHAENKVLKDDGYSDYLVKNFKSRILNDTLLKEDYEKILKGFGVLFLKNLGEERYAALSEKYGGDLASVYVSGRFERLFIEDLAQKKAPRNVIDYVFKTGLGESLPGLVLDLSCSRSSLDREVEDMANESYHASTAEKAVSFLFSNALDYAVLGGVGKSFTFARNAFSSAKIVQMSAIPWSTRIGKYAKFTGTELFVRGALSLIRNGSNELSKDIFGKSHVLDDIQDDAYNLDNGSHVLLLDNFSVDYQGYNSSYTVSTGYGQTCYKTLHHKTGATVDVHLDEQELAKIRSSLESAFDSSPLQYAESLPSVLSEIYGEDIIYPINIIDAILVLIICSCVAFVLPANENHEKYVEEYTQIQKDLVDKKITTDEYINKSKDVVYDIDYSNTMATLSQVVVFILYYVVFQYYNKGQTIGKKIMKIKVVSTKDKELSLDQVAIRALIADSILINLLLVGAVLFIGRNYYYFTSLGLQILDYAVIIVALLMVLFRKDGKGLHDLAAGTKVVNTK